VTTTPEEALEQAALAGVHRLAVPTPFAVGKVNAYLIEDDPLTLIDGGPNYGSGLDVLSESIAAHGHSIEDIGLILLTHNHTDHLGLAQIVVEHSGAEVGALGIAAERRPLEELALPLTVADPDRLTQLGERWGLGSSLSRFVAAVTGQ